MVTRPESPLRLRPGGKGKSVDTRSKHDAWIIVASALAVAVIAFAVFSQVR
jgi:hypothetical protein